MILIRALLHLLPLVPLYWGRSNLAIILLLFVLLCYIKTFKLRQQLLDLAAEGGDARDEASIRGALKRWEALTFLPTKQ